MPKLTIKERLKLKSNKELRAIAKRIGCPVGSNYTKIALVIALYEMFMSRSRWDAIVNG